MLGQACDVSGGVGLLYMYLVAEQGLILLHFHPLGVQLQLHAEERLEAVALLHLETQFETFRVELVFLRLVYIRVVRYGVDVVGVGVPFLSDRLDACVQLSTKVG